MIMDDLVLPLTYNGVDLELPLKMYRYGYVHRFEIEIENIPIIFEPDEEGSFRALISPEQMVKNRNLSIGLLGAIVEALVKLV